MKQIISFKIADKKFGFYILEVQEIIRIKKITPLPNVPEYVKGVLNLRGNIVPIIDLRKRFNFPEKIYTMFTRIIITNMKGQLNGFIVDNIEGVINVEDNKIKSNFKDYKGISPEFFQGVVEDKNNLILILNIETLIKNINSTQKELNYG